MKFLLIAIIVLILAVSRSFGKILKSGVSDDATNAISGHVHLLENRPSGEFKRHLYKIKGEIINIQDKNVKKRRKKDIEAKPSINLGNRDTSLIETSNLVESEKHKNLHKRTETNKGVLSVETIHRRDVEDTKPDAEYQQKRAREERERVDEERAMNRTHQVLDRLGMLKSSMDSIVENTPSMLKEKPTASVSRKFNTSKMTVAGNPNVMSSMVRFNNLSSPANSILSFTGNHGQSKFSNITSILRKLNTSVNILDKGGLGKNISNFIFGNMSISHTKGLEKVDTGASSFNPLEPTLAKYKELKLDLTNERGVDTRDGDLQLSKTVEKNEVTQSQTREEDYKPTLVNDKLFLNRVKNETRKTEVVGHMDILPVKMFRPVVESQEHEWNRLEESYVGALKQHKKENINLLSAEYIDEKPTPVHHGVSSKGIHNATQAIHNLTTGVLTPGDIEKTSSMMTNSAGKPIRLRLNRVDSHKKMFFAPTKNQNKAMLKNTASNGKSKVTVFGAADIDIDTSTPNVQNTDLNSTVQGDKDYTSKEHQTSQESATLERLKAMKDHLKNTRKNLNFRSLIAKRHRGSRKNHARQEIQNISSEQNTDRNGDKNIDINLTLPESSSSIKTPENLREAMRRVIENSLNPDNKSNSKQSNEGHEDSEKRFAPWFQPDTNSPIPGQDNLVNKYDIQRQLKETLPPATVVNKVISAESSQTQANSNAITDILNRMGSMPQAYREPYHTDGGHGEQQHDVVSHLVSDLTRAIDRQQMSSETQHITHTMADMMMNTLLLTGHPMEHLHGGSWPGGGGGSVDPEDIAERAARIFYREYKKGQDGGFNNNERLESILKEIRDKFTQPTAAPPPPPVIIQPPPPPAPPPVIIEEDDDDDDEEDDEEETSLLNPSLPMLPPILPPPLPPAAPLPPPAPLPPTPPLALPPPPPVMPPPAPPPVVLPPPPPPPPPPPVVAPPPPPPAAPPPPVAPPPPPVVAPPPPPPPVVAPPPPPVTPPIIATPIAPMTATPVTPIPHKTKHPTPSDRFIKKLGKKLNLSDKEEDMLEDQLETTKPPTTLFPTQPTQATLSNKMKGLLKDWGRRAKKKKSKNSSNEDDSQQGENTDQDDSQTDQNDAQTNGENDGQPGANADEMDEEEESQPGTEQQNQNSEEKVPAPTVANKRTRKLRRAAIKRKKSTEENRMIERIFRNALRKAAEREKLKQKSKSSKTAAKLKTDMKKQEKANVFKNSRMSKLSKKLQNSTTGITKQTLLQIPTETEVSKKQNARRYKTVAKHDEPMQRGRRLTSRHILTHLTIYKKWLRKDQ